MARCVSACIPAAVCGLVTTHCTQHSLLQTAVGTLPVERPSLRPCWRSHTHAVLAFTPPHRCAGCSLPPDVRYPGLRGLVDQDALVFLSTLHPLPSLSAHHCRVCGDERGCRHRQGVWEPLCTESSRPSPPHPRRTVAHTCTSRHCRIRTTPQMRTDAENTGKKGPKPLLTPLCRCRAPSSPQSGHTGTPHRAPVHP